MGENKESSFLLSTSVFSYSTERMMMVEEALGAHFLSLPVTACHLFPNPDIIIIIITINNAMIMFTLHLPL